MGVDRCWHYALFFGQGFKFKEWSKHYVDLQFATLIGAEPPKISHVRNILGTASGAPLPPPPHGPGVLLALLKPLHPALQLLPRKMAQLMKMVKGPLQMMARGPLLVLRSVIVVKGVRHPHLRQLYRSRTRTHRWSYLLAIMPSYVQFHLRFRILLRSHGFAHGFSCHVPKLSWYRSITE